MKTAIALLCALAAGARAFEDLAPSATFELASTYTMGGGCPNECSSHGYCRAHGKCFCFAGWAGFDCAQRECAFGKAWGVNDGIHQRPVECSYKGVCDRGSGECQCFEGYEGPACERTTCPNDCSGHGKCRYISELPLVPAGFDDDWEANRIQTCICDGGYFGADCSLRYCPRGDDPQTICDAITGMTQTMTFEFQSAPDMPTLDGDDIAITIVTNNGERFTTAPITGLFAAATGTATASPDVVDAIKAIPNFAAMDVSATVMLTGNVLAVAVTFNGQTSTGDQPLMECLPELNCNSDGCVPKVSLLDVDASAAATPIGITLDTPARLYGFDASGDMISGVKVEVIVDIDETSFSYEVTTFDASGALEAAPGAVTLPLPSQTSKKMDIGYGLQLTFRPLGAAYDAGTAIWEVHIPACSVAYTTYADPSSENAECSNRGLCDRSSGLCSCFDGFAGAGCEDQVIVI